MDYTAPPDLVSTMINAGATKSRLSVKDLMIRGFYSGALLGIAATLAMTTIVHTKFHFGRDHLPLGVCRYYPVWHGASDGQFGFASGSDAGPSGEMGEYATKLAVGVSGKLHRLSGRSLVN